MGDVCVVLEGEIEVRGQPGQTVLQNKHSTMDWRCSSRDRAPALQMQSPEFKPQKNKTPTFLLCSDPAWGT
jgi:hypothetical protein